MEERLEDKVKKALAKRLKRAREEVYPKSAAGFARSARLPVHKYQDWEAGRHLPSIPDMVRLCNLLQVDPNELLPMAVSNKAKGEERRASPRMRAVP